MQKAVPIGKGSMIAILGSNIKEINTLINSTKTNQMIYEVANDNAEGQVIISGDKESIDFFQKILKEKKIKTIPLRVSAPFHCSLMKPAAERMKGKIEKTVFKRPLVDIVSNVTAKVENDEKLI